MSLKTSSTNQAIIAGLAVAALAVAFWMLLLGPKRDEAVELGTEVEAAETSLAQHRAEVAEAVEARKEFAVDYQQLVVLGKAVPGDDDTASLLVQLNRIGDRAGARFTEIKLSSAGGGEPAAPAAPEPQAPGATPASSEPVSPTEAAAAAMPLGASIGPAGLAVMPYSLDFDGDFFEIADFIQGLDEMVETEQSNVSVDGRLITIDGFALTVDPDKHFPALQADFAVTTYLTPPSQGVTGGASPSAPAPSTATPAAATIGGTP